MKIVKIEKFIEELCAISTENFGVENIFGFLAQTPVEPVSLESFLYFSRKCYTRNLIFKNELFELMAICWDAGQSSSIHNHSEQKCWMSVPIGNLRIKNFKTLELDEKRNYCRIEEAENYDICQNVSAKVEMDEPVHQVLNVTEKRAVSLHIYSKPFDKCLVYSIPQNSFTEVQLCYTSMFGKLCAGAEL